MTANQPQTDVNSLKIGLDELEISEVLLIKNPDLIAKIKELKSDDTAGAFSFTFKWGKDVT
jgi:hypothetical protein